MLFRMDHIIVDHLNGFCILNHNVLLVHHGLHKVLVDQFPEAAPLVSVLHDEQMVAAGDEVV